MIAKDALCDGVECAGIREVKVGLEEDGGHGVERGEEPGEAGGEGGRVGGRGLDEAVPLWRNCAEVGVKVLAPHAGQLSGGDGWECGVGLWGCLALVGVVEHI